MKFSTVSTLLAVLAAAPSAMAAVPFDGCLEGPTNNDDINNPPTLFGTGFVFGQKWDNDAGELDGATGGNLDTTLDTLEGDVDSCPAGSQYMLVIKGGQGSDPSNFIACDLGTTPLPDSIPYTSPFANPNNGNPAGISHITIYCKPPELTTTPVLTTKPVAEGDPHILTWSGKFFDYMGECDLNMMHAPKFDGHRDMNIDIRTTIQHDYSYIEAIALQIGDDVLEVGSYGDFAVNGVDTPYLGGKAGRLGGYALHHTEVSKKKHVYNVILSESENITLASYKQLVSIHINVEESKQKYFANSHGIIGNINGDIKSRDGSNMELGNAFAEEWQVTDAEPMNFRVAREPQFPAKCRMPAPKSTARRLGETLAEEAAEKACAHKTGVAFSNCVYDVMATGDLDIAGAGSM